MSEASERVLSVAEVASRWRVSERVVYGLCGQGRLGHLRIGGQIRIRPADVEQYEARAAVSAPATLAAAPAPRAPAPVDGRPYHPGRGFLAGQRYAAEAARRKAAGTN